MGEEKRTSKIAQGVGEKSVYEALSYLQKDLKLDYSEIASVLKLSERAVARWFSAKRVCKKNHLIVSQLILVYKNLRSMFSVSENRIAWLKTRHRDFGKSPLEKMKESRGLQKVRMYLDYIVKVRGA
ncbi:MAG: hypothetical protein A3I89_03645 [Candidatus Harrisonbacteria bacterium RIFCSPLOWO2_02_FULL_41_11]|uniref:Antitoxin Xre/MbcA/ParS-like toxin-binding domain-containing protein n=1 Tax=Candidatus Harrisonbacteria bacterium RIFCSPHIGHO2_02_FULL_42_16 TaxID=1798404 RepID=A0A1G1ZGM2_9BACT|nr:MAG: hypothetical protein A3B92_02105 [Candidatus Harrisonbacteria bacterium RIFCSPHIGHO2_02_FULL_42_16]OGY65906.1 MAG: hypothetical protein A3I89_03645 [Candidatus Harrisonbacteria bacterium RIFCSPLOWO2_02_FULL_41_11]